MIRFYERPYPFLFDYNLDLLQFIFQKKLGWKGRFILTETYCPENEWVEGTDYRNSFSGEQDHYPEWFKPQRYAQVFAEKSGFLPNLSLLDLLFCQGKRSDLIL